MIGGYFMGFTNTSYRDTADSIVSSFQQKYSKAAPYYKFIDKKPTTVDYWNLSTTRTTFDMATEQAYDQLGDESPLRFNKVKAFQLYGLTKMHIDLQIGEFGPESSPIEGDAYVLPNTIIPSADDYFTILSLYGKDAKMVFRVTEVQKDTIDNGANFYRIHYVLDRPDMDAIKHLNRQTVKIFEYMPGNVGTNFVTLMEDKDKTALDALADMIGRIRQFYIDLFYKKNIQTFVYLYNDEYLFYDSYLIEFLIRNKIMQSSNDDFLYISQATFRSSTFSIEYARTIFLNFEENDHELSLNTAYPIQICDPNSLLMDRLEEYFELSVLKQNYSFTHPINILDMDLFDRIVNGELYDEEDINNPIYRNIIIGYMKDGLSHTISKESLDSIRDIDFRPSKDLFYELPLLMFVMTKILLDGMTDKSNDDNWDVENKCYMTRN